jgi:outer membrane protein
MKKRNVISWVLLVVLSVTTVTLEAQEKRVLSLNDCIKIALKNNTDIVSAKSNYQMSKEGLRAAWGNFLPSIDAYGQWRKRNEELIMFRYKDFVRSKDSYYYSFTLRQPLFTGFSNYASLKKNKAEEKMYNNYLTWTEQQTVLKVKLQYYAVLKAKQLLKVAEETFKASEEELVRIETMEKIGSASKAEVYQQKVRVGQYKLALIEAQNNLSNAKTDLNYTLGIDINTVLEPEEESLELQMIEVDFNELINQALQNRVDYRAAIENVKSAKSDITIRKSNYYPQIALDADYNWYDVRFPESAKDLKQFDNYSISLNISVNLFNGLRTKANINSAKAGLISAEAELEQTKRQVNLDVKKAVLNLQKAAENIEVTNENLISAEEDYRLASERYKIGAGTLLEQITAESSLTKAKADRIQALYDYKYTLAALDLVVGRLSIIE